MATARIVHTHACDEQTFWEKIHFNPEFNRENFLSLLKFERWERVEFKEDDKEIRQRILVVPSVANVPSALKALIGSGIRYEETGVFDKQSRRYTMKVVPSSMADKLDIHGAVHVESAAEKRVSVVFEYTVKANVFAVGGMLERKILADTEESYGKSARFADEYLARLGV